MVLIAAVVAVLADIAVIALLHRRSGAPAIKVLPAARQLHELRALVATDPNDPELRLSLGESYVMIRHWLSAREQLNAAKRLGADEWRTLQARVSVNIGLLRYDQVIPDLERMVELRPKRLDTYLALSEAYEMNRDPEAARRALERIPKDASGFPVENSPRERMVAAEKVAVAYGHLGDWGAALRLIDRVHMADPQRLSPKVMRGKALHALGRKGEAVPFLIAGVRAAPDNPELQYLLGSAYRARKKPGDEALAFQCFGRAVALNDTHGPAVLELARAYERRGDLKKAASAYFRANELGMEGGLPLLWSGDLLLKLGEREEGWYRRGLYYEQQKKYELAAAEYEKLTRIHSCCRSGYLHLARVHKETKQAIKRLDYLKRAEKLEPERAKELRWALVEAYDDAQQRDTARKILLELAGSGEDAAVARSFLSSAADGAGDLDEAEDWIRKALDLKPEEGQYYLEYGKLLLQRRQSPHKLEKGTEVLEKAIQLMPERPEPFYYLGLAYLEANRLDEAVLALRHAVDLRPEIGEAYKTLAQALLKAGKREEAGEMQAVFRRFQNFDQARQILVARIRRNPGDLDSYLRLGEFHMAAGELEPAVSSFERVLRLDPRNQHARSRLADALGSLGRREEQRAQLALLKGGGRGE